MDHFRSTEFRAVALPIGKVGCHCYWNLIKSRVSHLQRPEILPMTRYRCVLIAICLNFSLTGGAEAGSESRWRDLAQPVFQTIGPEGEAPQNNLLAIAQDRGGFLWLGTQAGLSRRDGYRFHHYRAEPETAGSLGASYIRVLHVDPGGRLWIGTDGGGLARYLPEQDRFAVITAGLAGLSHVNVNALADYGAGRLWVGTDGGLDRLDADRAKVSHDSLTTTPISAVLRDRKGDVWVGVKTGGLVRLRGGAAKPEVVAFSGGGDPVVRQLFEDDQARIWIGTLVHGAYLFDPDTGRAVGLPGSEVSHLDNEDVISIAQVKPGEIWLGTYRRGIFAVDSANFRQRRIRRDPAVQSSLNDDNVTSLFRDRAGLIWVGTYRGLSRHDPSNDAMITIFGSSTMPDGLSDPSVGSVMAATDGQVWFGLFSHGVEIFDPLAKRTGALRPDPQTPLAALPAHTIWAMAEAPGGAVYFGTNRGLYHLERRNNRITRLDLPGRDPESWVNSLVVDDGVIWAGSSVDGFWRIDLDGHGAGRVGHEVTSQLTDQRVQVIAPGPDHSLWIGTRNGLNRLNPSTGAVTTIP